MPQEHTLKIVARMRSDFADKFGIPRQSGLVPALEAPGGRPGPPPCARPAWGATCAWGCLPPAPPSGPAPSA